MNNKDNRFPKIKKTINDFINDEDGSITRSKLITVGSMVLLMTIIAGIEAHADHVSHTSHSSHSSTSYNRGHVSHVSHTSHSSGAGNHSSHSSSSHSNHGSHSNHSNHASHSSHTSHANTASHSNSLYSAEGDVKYGPKASDIPGVLTPQSTSKYSNIKLNDQVTMISPAASETQTVNEMQDVDIAKGNNI